jgi:protein-tyrosine-phosphatase
LSEGLTPCRILFVCTANICRSPAAEYLARDRYGARGVAVFRSAGFWTQSEPCPAYLLRALAEVGVDASPHRSYKVDDASLRAADLVLTMEGEHVQGATLMCRDAYPKIFPLKEAAQTMERLNETSVDLDDFLYQANLDRSPTTYLTTRWTVDDPYGHRLRDYRRAVAEIGDLVDAVIGRLS